MLKFPIWFSLTKCGQTILGKPLFFLASLQCGQSAKKNKDSLLGIRVLVTVIVGKLLVASTMHILCWLANNVMLWYLPCWPPPLVIVKGVWVQVPLHVGNYNAHTVSVKITTPWWPWPCCTTLLCNCDDVVAILAKLKVSYSTPLSDSTGIIRALSWPGSCRMKGELFNTPKKWLPFLAMAPPVPVAAIFVS